jgi:hypothetical protein
VTRIKLQELFLKDVHLVNRSYSEAFPEVKQDSIVNLLTWKFFSGVNPGNYWALSTENDSDIAGGYGILAMPLSGEAQFGLVADVYTTPKYQKQGVFTALGEAVRLPIKKLGYDFAIGFPIRSNVLPGHIKVGWNEAFFMPVYGSFPVAKAFKSFIRRTNKNEYISSEQFSGARDDVLNLFKETSTRNDHQHLTSTKLTGEYLNWRLSRPGVKYTETILKDADGVKAWIVSRKVYIKGIAIWAILDVQSNSLSVHQTKLIMDHLSRLAIASKCLILAGCWNPSYAGHLNVGLKMGFFRIGKQGVIYRSHNSNLSFPAENQIRLSWLDSDTL